jgi:hypothetical protein
MLGVFAEFETNRRKERQMGASLKPGLPACTGVVGDRLFPVYKKLSGRDKRLATEEGYQVPPRGDLMPRRLSA